jgi:hypothetical protein
MRPVISREGLANLFESKQIANNAKLGMVLPENCHPQGEIETFELLS